MKKTISILLFLCVSLVGMAQDVIVKKDGNTIFAKVLEVTSKEVKYKKHTNLEGPTYTISKTEIQSINYENGEKEVFDAKEETSPAETLPPLAEESSSQRLSDVELLNLYRHGNVVQSSEKPQKVIDPNLIDNQVKKGKKLKKIGLIGGVGLIGGGIVSGIITTICSDSEDVGYIFGFITAPVASAGAIWWVSFASAGSHKIKKYSSIQSTSLFQHEIPLGNNTMLTADVNLLNDNLTLQKTVGLGCHINF